MGMTIEKLVAENDRLRGMIYIVRLKILRIELDIIKGLHAFFAGLCRKLWVKRNKICLKIWEALSRKNETPVRIYIDDFIGEQIKEK